MSEKTSMELSPPTTTVTVVNNGPASFDLKQTSPGNWVVTIHPAPEYRYHEFPDGSVGLECGIDWCDRPARRVEAGRGGRLSWVINAFDTDHPDWTECDAARWLSNAGVGWTIVQKTEVDDKLFRAAARVLGMDANESRGATGVGVVGHETD